MNIKIIAVGKLKEKYSKDAIEEFKKRLGAYCNISCTEIPAQEIKDDNMAQKYMEIEGQKILSAIKKDSYVITLEIKGNMLSSEDFAQKINTLAIEGYHEIVFVIGVANGLSKDVSARANYKLSFSKMTFTHQLVRIFLYEQIYRAFKIINNENYHR